MTAPNALRRSHRGRRADAGGTLIGIFIGIVVGLGLAAGVAYWLMKNNPALSIQGTANGKAPTPSGTGSSASATPDKPRFDFYKILPGVEEATPQPDAGRTAASRNAPAPGQSVTANPGPGAATGRAAAPAPAGASASAAVTAPAAAARVPETAARGGARSWLQAGSFTTDADAENLKARLALAGLEAAVQQATLPDGSLRYRVRLGPYDNADEVTRMKSELAKRGFDVAVVRF